MFDICGDLEQYKEFNGYVGSCKTYTEAYFCILDLQKKHTNNKFWIEQ